MVPPIGDPATVRNVSPPDPCRRDPMCLAFSTQTLAPASIKDPVLKVYSESRRLGNLDHAVVYLERLLQGALEHVRREGGRIVRELEVRGVGDGGGEVQVRDHPQGISPRVGDDLDRGRVRHGGKRPGAQEPFAQGDVGLENIVATVEEQSLPLDEPLVHFAPGDGDRGALAQSSQSGIVLTRQRFLQPLDRVIGKRIGGAQRAMITPARAGKRRILRVGLIGVDHDRHSVAHGVAHGSDLRQVVGQRVIVDTQFDRSKPLVAKSPRVVRPLRGGPVLTGGSVRGYGIPDITQQLVQRESGRLAKHIPERDLDEPDGRPEVGPQVPKRSGMLLNLQRILPDQIRGNALHTLLLGPVILVPRDAGDAGIGIDSYIGDTSRGLEAPGIPGRVEGLRQRNVHLPRSDAGDAHTLVPRRLTPGSHRAPRRRAHLLYPMSVRAFTANAMASLFEPCAPRANIFGITYVWYAFSARASGEAGYAARCAFREKPTSGRNCGSAA